MMSNDSVEVWKGDVGKLWWLRGLNSAKLNKQAMCRDDLLTRCHRIDLYTMALKHHLDLTFQRYPR